MTSVTAKSGFEKVQESTSAVTAICERNLRHRCHLTEGCQHYALPYQWQICNQQSLFNLPLQQNVEVERAYCQPASDFHSFQVTLDGNAVNLEVSFEILQAKCVVNGIERAFDVQRLSTRSYISDKEIVSRGGKTADSFVTQWRWYYYGDGLWKLFGPPLKAPQQYVLEAKYLCGQAVYRFNTDTDGEFVIKLLPVGGRQHMTSLRTGDQWDIRRRPLFILPTATHPLECPPITVSPFANSLPTNWYPVDGEQDYELVPLDPSGMEYHLVASAFHDSISYMEQRITDIFRIQNVFMWHKYCSKRQQMEIRRERQGVRNASHPLERQLFHGTRSEEAVQAIFRENFDWRLSGTANNECYGRGAYFAVDASFSDRYANSASSVRLSWMFLARVLVGQSAVGRREYLRPPPISSVQQHGELYDSCVNDLRKPAIFVIFDTDQCYPEYVISYTAAS